MFLNFSAKVICDNLENPLSKFLPIKMGAMNLKKIEICFDLE